MRATEDEVFRLGHAIRIEPRSAWPGNATHEGMLVRLWVGPHRHFRLAVANLAPSRAQAYIPLHVPELAGMEIHLDDQIGPDTYVRDGDDLLPKLYSTCQRTPATFPHQPCFAGAHTWSATRRPWALSGYRRPDIARRAGRDRRQSHIGGPP
jgi:hypothetical protein